MGRKIEDHGQEDGSCQSSLSVEDVGDILRYLLLEVNNGGIVTVTISHVA